MRSTMKFSCRRKKKKIKWSSLTSPGGRINNYRTVSGFGYLYIIHLCLLGEDGGLENAVKATSQDSDDKEVEEEADEVNPTFLFACAIRYFLLDPLLLQIRLGRT